MSLFSNKSEPAFYGGKPKRINISSVEYRDGQQSLLGTRMRSEDMYPILHAVDQAGFSSVEMWGGATFDVAMRYLGEDPWDRIRGFKSRMSRTPLRMYLRAQNLVGYRQYPDDIVERFIQAASNAGIDIFLMFDGLNDLRNCETSIKAVKKAGKIAAGTIIYTISPVHSTETFVNIAREYQRMGVSAVHLEDTSGSMTPRAAYEITLAMKKALSVPFNLQCHSTGGMADMAYWEAVRAGVDGLDMDVASLSLGTSHPPMESFMAALKGTPYELDLSWEHVAKISGHFQTVREKYREFESKFTGVDIGVLQHQIPGGMLSNMELQLKQMNAIDRLDEILEEFVMVRKDFGYPPLATPFSQIIGAQATMNVMAGKRYTMLSKESKDYITGKYGKAPGEISPDLSDMVLHGQPPIACRPADLLQPEYDSARAQSADFARTEEDILSYALFPQVAEAFLRKKYGLAYTASK